MARNFTLPYIPQEKYERIGKIVNKYQLNLILVMIIEKI